MRWGLAVAACLLVVLVVGARALMIEIRRSYNLEPTTELRQIFDSSVSYYDDLAASDRPGRFPDSVGLTPGPADCVDGQVPQREPNAADWAAPTWRALGFTPYRPTRHRYEFISTGAGRDAAFTARAIGDLDCDGVFVTFERTGRIGADGRFDGGPGLSVPPEGEE